MKKTEENFSDDRKNVLIVDDNSIMLEALKLLLEKNGYHVSTALGGQIGLDKFKDSHYDLIYSDIEMPGMNGAEFILRIRELDKNVKIVVSTYYTKAELNRRFSLVGDEFDSYLQIPFRPNDLLKAINNLLERTNFKI